MAIKTSWAAGDVLAAADLTDTFAAKAPTASPTFSGTMSIPATDGEHYEFSRDASTGFLKVLGDQNTFSGFMFQSTTGSSPVTRLQIANNGAMSGVGLSLGAWTAYTPVISGGTWAIGNGTVSGFYCKVGRTVKVRAQFTLGSTSVIEPTAALEIGVPFNMVTTPQYALATGQGVDVSLGNSFLLATLSQTSNFAIYALQSAAGLIEAVITTKPFTWTTGDIVRLAAEYEATA